jgi:hypothetical protein
MLSKTNSGEKTLVLTQTALIVDLELSDTEYLELLSQGRNPVREQQYVHELIGYGFSVDQAKRVAPLFDKEECAIAEKILVHQTLKQIWQQLTLP